MLHRIWQHPANKDFRFAAVRRFIRWQYRKRLTNQPMLFNYHGSELLCYPDSKSTSAAWYFSGLPDYSEMRFILDYLRPGDRFIDVGANIGLYTFLAASIIGESGHIDAFEPGKIPATRLTEAINRNNFENIEIHQYGVSDTQTVVSFNPGLDDCTAHISTNTESSNQSQSIKTVRLDKYLPAHKYAMAKFDIEGFEPFALRGAEALLRDQNPPVLQIEMNGCSKRYGVSSHELVAELQQFGYDCAVYQPETLSLRYSDQPWELGAANVLAISHSRKDFVLARLKV